ENGLLTLCILLAFFSVYGLGYWVSTGRPIAGLMTNMAGLALFWNTLNWVMIIPFLVFLHRHSAAGQPAHVIAVPETPATLRGGDGTS
ncbi:hypothetical protein NYZ42_18375, partial [Acinetobacter baumannii]|nr:hypothetical protein [Acinetobacter baumannii]